MYDVLIIGGGPTGSQAAFRISKLGYRVVVIDKKPTMTVPVCCTGIVSEECIREYQISEDVIYRHVSGASIYAPSGTSLKVERVKPQAAVLDRPLFNEFMYKRALAEGAEFITGTHAKNIKTEPDLVKTLIEGANGESTIVSRTVIIASGTDISLSRQKGLETSGVIAAGAQTEVDSMNVKEVEIYTGKSITPGFFAWLVPTSENKALAGLLSKRRPAEHLNIFLALLKSRGKISTNGAVITGTVFLKSSRQTYADRILVAGTAAGLVKPTTGGGIYYGLISADIAAETLHQAFREGNFSRATLSQYQRRWQDILDREFKSGMQARSIYEHLNDDQLDKIFDIIVETGIINELANNEDLKFDWHRSTIRYLLQKTSLATLLKGVRVFLPGRKAERNTFTKEEREN